MNARVDKNDRAIINLGVRVADLDQIESIIDKLKQIAEVEKVFRSSGQ